MRTLGFASAAALSITLMFAPQLAAASQPDGGDEAEADDDAGGEASAESDTDADAKPIEEKSSKSGGSASVSTSGAKASGTKSKRRGKGAPMKGRVGFGAMRTIAGLNGLVVRGYAANRFTIGANFGVATFSHRDVDEDGEFGRVRTVGAVGIGPEFLFWPYQGDRSNQVHADFGVGARVTAYLGFLGRLEEERGNTLDIPVEIDIEVPLALQLFIGQRVAIMPEFGVAFRIIPGSREPDQNGEFDSNPGRGIGSARGTTDGPGFGFELGDHAGLFMGIGFAYFFGKTPE